MVFDENFMKICPLVWMIQPLKYFKMADMDATILNCQSGDQFIKMEENSSIIICNAKL